MESALYSINTLRVGLYKKSHSFAVLTLSNTDTSPILAELNTLRPYPPYEVVNIYFIAKTTLACR